MSIVVCHQVSIPLKLVISIKMSSIRLIHSICKNYNPVFVGEMYTLVTVDPDVPVSTVGTEERPLLHWLVTNIEHGNIMTGTSSIT